MPVAMPVNLRRLGEWLLFVILFGVLGFQIVRSAGELLLSPCPAHETISERAEARAVCPESGGQP